jgi:hypothetical protein
VKLVSPPYIADGLDEIHEEICGLVGPMGRETLSNVVGIPHFSEGPIFWVLLGLEELSQVGTEDFHVCHSSFAGKGVGMGIQVLPESCFGERLGPGMRVPPSAHLVAEGGSVSAFRPSPRVAI